MSIVFALVCAGGALLSMIVWEMKKDITRLENITSQLDTLREKQENRIRELEVYAEQLKSRVWTPPPPPDNAGNQGNEPMPWTQR